MDFLELSKTRYAVRDYEDREIEDATLMQILEAGRIAPTAANRQSQRLYIIYKEDMARFEGAFNVHGAQLAILVCSDITKAWVRGFDQMNAGVIDASIVCTQMMNEATQLGIGSLWVCAFDPEKVKTLCALEDGVIPVNILCLGYATKPADTTRFEYTRKPLSEILLHK